jgi:nucleoid-associated protein YgaU
MTSGVVGLSARTTAAANAEAARVAAANAEAARVAAANAEAARKAKEQKELMEILAIIPKIGGLALSLGETTNSLFSTKCVKGKNTQLVKKGAKCPKGFIKK